MTALLGASGALQAADFQGVIVDWNCAKRMVENGREQTLRQNRKCSMMRNWRRSAYALITDDKKYYRLDGAANSKIVELLNNTPDKDNLKVVVSGDNQGGTIHIVNISML